MNLRFMRLTVPLFIVLSTLVLLPSVSEAQSYSLTVQQKTADKKFVEAECRVQWGLCSLKADLPLSNEYGGEIAIVSIDGIVQSGVLKINFRSGTNPLSTEPQGLKSLFEKLDDALVGKKSIDLYRLSPAARGDGEFPSRAVLRPPNEYFATVEVTLKQKSP